MSTAKRRYTDDFDTQPAAPKKKTVRHRVTLACEECRARKRRCDGATPACGGCVKRISVCVYASEIQAKEWRDNMIHSLRARLEELEKEDDSTLGPDRISRHDSHVATSTPYPDPGIETGGVEDVQPLRSPEVTSQTVLPSVFQDQVPLRADAPCVQTQSVISPRPRSPHDYNLRGLEPCSVEKLMKPIDQAIDSRGDQNSALSNPSWPKNATVNGPCSISATSCYCEQLLNASRWHLPLRGNADDLVALYFARVNRMYPTLHEQTFRKQYEYLWQLTTRASTTSSVNCPGLCKQKSKGKTFPGMVYAVFALASLFESGTPEQNTSRAEDYFRLAQDIDLLGTLDHEVGIELVQLGLLMGFYLQSTERFSKCWNITGLTIRMAQNMGLQLRICEARRKGLIHPHSTQLDCEMRVRVWYGCVLLDREISLSFGRQLMIFSGGEAVRLPKAIDDNRLSEEMGTWNVQPPGHMSLLESYIQTIKLYDILKQVLDREELQDSSDRGPDIQSLLSLDTMIMEWREALPSCLQYDSSSEGTSSAEQHRIPGIAIPQVDFSAQAKRLYARFLHVRVLILRPALDLLFQKQRHPPPLAKKGSMEIRVQDLMLSDIATQCASSANSLVKLLAAQIHQGNLVAWWYNISYLHTCGSTLLMAQLSTLNDMALSRELSGSWDLCLRCISRYKRVSSIAEKSARLLEKSRRCLLPEEYPQKTTLGDDAHAMTPIRALPNNSPQVQQQHLLPQSQAATSPETYHLNKDQPPIDNAEEYRLDQEWNLAQPGTHKEQEFPVDLISESAVDAPRFDGPDGDLWANDTCASSYWSFMPFLSQLEALPLDFDPPNLE